MEVGFEEDGGAGVVRLDEAVGGCVQETVVGEVERCDGGWVGVGGDDLGSEELEWGRGC